MLRRAPALAALVAAVVALPAGCKTGETRPLSPQELDVAGEALAASLKTIETKPRATVVIVGERTDPLVERGDKGAVLSGKFAEVLHDRERKPDYAIVPERDAEGGGTWELIEVTTNTRLFKSSWSRAGK